MFEFGGGCRVFGEYVVDLGGVLVDNRECSREFGVKLGLSEGVERGSLVCLVGEKLVIGLLLVV